MVYRGYPENAETHHAMGHTVYLNDTAKLSCKESTSVNAPHFNRRTCNIAGLVHIPAGYHLGVKITYNNTIINFDSAKSFWGVFKLYDLS